METDRPGRRRPAGSWLFLDSESRRQRNHEPRQPEIPKRKKSDIHTRLSCKIDYLLRSNHNDQSIASEFFTGDYVMPSVAGSDYSPPSVAPPAKSSPVSPSPDHATRRRGSR